MNRNKHLLLVYVLMILPIYLQASQEAKKPTAQQQTTTWSRAKRWGLYITGASAALLGSYVAYKQTIGKKASVVSPKPQSLVEELHNDLDSVKSLKVLDEKAKEYAEKDTKHREFIQNDEGRRLYFQVKKRIEENIDQANNLVKSLGLQLPQSIEARPTYDTEMYLNSLLTKVLVDSEHEKPIILYHSVLFREFTDQHLVVFKKLIELGANPATTGSSDVEIMQDAFRKYMQDEGSAYEGVTIKSEQLPYDREIIKTLVLNGGMIPFGNSSKIAGIVIHLMKKDPELRKFFKEQGYSNDGIKYKSWWK